MRASRRSPTGSRPWPRLRSPTPAVSNAPSTPLDSVFLIKPGVSASQDPPPQRGDRATRWRGARAMAGAPASGESVKVLSLERRNPANSPHQPAAGPLGASSPRGGGGGPRETRWRGCAAALARLKNDLGSAFNASTLRTPPPPCFAPACAWARASPCESLADSAARGGRAVTPSPSGGGSGAVMFDENAGEGGLKAVAASDRVAERGLLRPGPGRGRARVVFSTSATPAGAALTCAIASPSCST